MKYARRLSIVIGLGVGLLLTPPAWGGWIFQQKVQAPDLAANDYFGSPVAISGDYILTASPEDDDTVSGSGSANVFKRTGGAWSHEDKLVASAPASGQRYAESLAMDGDWAFIGARYHDGPATDCGAVYAYQRSGTTWTQKQMLQSSDIAGWDWFGLGVAVDGDYAVIGAFGDTAGASESGSAYVFHYNGSSWVQQAKLTAAGAGSSDWMGTRASISGDTIVVGAYGDDHSGLSNAGSAYVFEKPGTGWADMTQTAKLTASDAGTNAYFLGSVVDGDTIIASARNDSTGSGLPAIYVFEEPVGGWADMTETAKLTASDAEAGDSFHALDVDGETIVGGAYNADHSGLTEPGAVYTFQMPGGGWADATEDDRLTAFDAADTDYFGVAVALEAGTLVVGARQDDDGGTDTGSAYIYNVPEPASAGLLLAGLAVLARRRRTGR